MEQRDGRESVSRSRVVSRARRVDADLPAALRAFSGPRMAWFPPSGPAVVGCGAVATVRADGPNRFARVRSDAAALLDTVDDGAGNPPGPRLMGGFAFTDDHEAAPPWRGFPGAYFVLPRVQVVRDGDRTFVRVQAVGPSVDPADVEDALAAACETVESATADTAVPPGIVGTERTPDREGWERQVAAAVDRIRAGDLRKVVLASALTAGLGAPFRLTDALARLVDAYRDCHRFAVDPGMGTVFFGATPERLVAKRGDRVETEALAGSIGRGGTPQQDRRLSRRLADSDKDQHEHRLVVEAIRDQLDPVARAVLTGDQTVRKLDSVQHLHTPITADLADDAHVIDLVERLHPTPAVGGLPPDAARETIRETETFDRGWYAAPVGWLDASGDGAFAVGIRSAVATGDTATLFAGNGIVADSDPGEEWDEMQLKFRPMLDQLR